MVGEWKLLCGRGQGSDEEAAEPQGCGPALGPAGWLPPGHLRGPGWGQGQFSADPSLRPQSQDAGTYTCTAENPVGRARRRVHLTILALPVFTTLPGDRSLRPGDRLWLRCAARGSPTPRIGWTVNDRPVTGLGLGRWTARDPGRLRRAGRGSPRSQGGRGC